MANRFPLVIDTTDGNKLKEIPAGDNLDLRNVSIVNVQDVNALGTINAAQITINGDPLDIGVFTDMGDTPNSYSAQALKLVRVNANEDGLEFFELGSGETAFAVTTLTVSTAIQPDEDEGADIGSDSLKFNEIHSRIFQGSLKGFDGSTIFDATTNQIPYAAIVGGPTSTSDLTNDSDFVTRDELLDGSITVQVSNTGDLQGSVFGEDSTLLVDHINNRINTSRLMRNGANPGQTIVWDDATATWVPGTAGDITGFASNKSDTLTVETGYKITFADNPGVIEADGFTFTAATDAITLNGAVEVTGNVEPDTTETGSVGTASKKFNEGHFVTLTADTLLGAFEGDLVNNETRSDSIVAGDKTAGNAGYGLHIVNTTAGVTNSTVNFNGNDLIAANLVNVTGDITGSVFADDSTVMVDAVAGKIRGDIEFPTATGNITGTNIVVNATTISVTDLIATQTIYPENNNGGSVGILAKRFGNGYFDELDVTTLDVNTLTVEDLTATNFSISGTGTGVIESSTDLTLSAGNRVSITGGPLKVANITDANLALVVGQTGDVVYNSTNNRFQFFENTDWVELHRGRFTGDLVGSVFADDSTVLYDALQNKLFNITVSGNSTFENNLTVSGNLTVQGTTTSIETTNTNITDNIIELNSGETGTGVTLGTSGIEIDRGLADNRSFLWDETVDKWTLGTQTFVAGTVEANLTGDVTGNVDGNVTGNVDGIVGGTTPNAGTFTTIVSSAGITGDTTGYHIGDVTGSVFGDDSTVIVDAVNNNLKADDLNINTINSSSTLGITSGAGIVARATDMNIGATAGPLYLSSNGSAVTLSGDSGAGSIAYDDSTGNIDLGTTGTITIQGAATSPVNVGTGTTGTVTIAHASNNTNIVSTVDFQEVITLRKAGSANITNDDNSVTAYFLDNTNSFEATAAFFVNAPLSVFSNDVRVDAVLYADGGIQGDIRGSLYSDDSVLIIDGQSGTLAGDGITGQGTKTFEITTPLAASPEAIELAAGDATGGNAGGQVRLYAGDSNSGTGGNAIIKAGNSTSGTGGNVYIDAGDGSTDGNINIGTNFGTGATAEVVIGTSGAVETTVNGTAFRLRTTNIPSSSVGAAGDRIGEVAFDGSSIYFCVNDYDGVTNIWRKQNWQFAAAW